MVIFSSKSISVYQHGVDLTLISQWLDHAKIETTQALYAKADTEHKRRAMVAANNSDPLANKLNSERFIIDDDRIKRLYGLKD